MIASWKTEKWQPPDSPRRGVTVFVPCVAIPQKRHHRVKRRILGNIKKAFFFKIYCSKVRGTDIKGMLHPYVICFN